MSYLYVIEIADRVKVGRSVNPSKRLETHRTQARMHGVESGRCWVSAPDVGTPGNEQRLISWCADRAERRFGGEYFCGVDFDDVVAFAASVVPWTALTAWASNYVNDDSEFRASMADQRLSKRRLAEVVGCSLSTVSRVLQGQRVGPALARDFARALGRSVDDIFAEAVSSDEQQSDSQEAVA